MIWLILAAPAAPAACELNCLLERNASGDRVPVICSLLCVDETWSVITGV